MFHGFKYAGLVRRCMYSRLACHEACKEASMHADVDAGARMELIASGIVVGSMRPGLNGGASPDFIAP